MAAERQANGPLTSSRLWAARAVWLVLIALALLLWAVGNARFLSEPIRPAAEVSDPSVFTVEDVAVLRDLGLPEVLARGPVVLLFLLLDVAYFVVAALIFWKRSNDRMALLVSFVLVFLGAIVFSYAFEGLSRGNPAWSVLTNSLLLVGIVSLALLLYLFPDGKFVPGWSRFLPILFGAALSLSYVPLPKAMRDTAGIISLLGFLGTGVYAQVYRYRRVSTLV